MKKMMFLFFAAFLTLFSGLALAAVDINSATASDLESVKGIGPAKAKAIIDYREKNGPFKSVDDLKGVKGFGVKTIDKLRPELSVGGGAAAAPAVIPAPSAPKAAPAPAPTAVPAVPAKK